LVAIRVSIWIQDRIERLLIIAKQGEPPPNMVRPPHIQQNVVLVKFDLFLCTTLAKTNPSE